jgi:hypothetical protein
MYYPSVERERENLKSQLEFSTGKTGKTGKSGDADPERKTFLRPDTGKLQESFSAAPKPSFGQIRPTFQNFTFL